MDNNQKLIKLAVIFIAVLMIFGLMKEIFFPEEVDYDNDMLLCTECKSWVVIDHKEPGREDDPCPRCESLNSLIWLSDLLDKKDRNLI